MGRNIVIQKKSLYLRSKASRRIKMTEVMKRERVRKIRFFFLGFIGLLIFCAFMYFLFFSPYAEIRKISVEENPRTISREEILAVVESYENDSMWNVFSRRNFFFFSERTIQERIQGQFLTLKNVSLKKKFPDSVKIHFSERDMIAYWCGSQKCFGIDREGYVLSEIADAESIRGNIDRPYLAIVDESRETASLRDTVIDQGVLTQYREWDDFFRTRLGQQGSLLFSSQSLSFEEYRVRTRNNWDIRVSKNIPVQDTLRSLQAFLETLPIERKEKIESIDLRVEGKIFFTERKNENVNESNELKEDSEEKKGEKDKNSER